MMECLQETGSQDNLVVCQTVRDKATQSVGQEVDVFQGVSCGPAEAKESMGKPREDSGCAVDKCPPQSGIVSLLQAPFGKVWKAPRWGTPKSSVGKPSKWH